MLALMAALLITRFPSRRHRAFAALLALQCARNVAWMLSEPDGAWATAAMNTFGILSGAALVWFALVVLWPQRAKWQGFSLAGIVVATTALVATDLPPGPLADAFLPLSALAAVAFALQSAVSRGQHAASLAILAVATAVYPAFYASVRLQASPPVSSLADALTVVAYPWVAAVGCAAVALILFFRPPTPANHARAYPAAIFGAAGISGTWAIAPWNPDLFFFLAFWRLVSVALIGYALLRHHLFDTSVRVRQSVARSAIAAFMVTVVFGVTEAAVDAIEVATGSKMVGVLGASFVFLLLVPLERWADRIARGLHDNRPLETLEKDERAALYRDQVVLVWADGTMGRKERALLDHLRERMRVSLTEAARIEQDVLRHAAHLK